MKFKVVTDSSSDIHELLGVDFESSPLKIITDDKEYIDDKNLDVDGMLRELKAYKGRSRSSCPSSGEYLEAFADAENVFCVTITSGLSGSFNSANAAAKQFIEKYPERKIHIIDSLSTGPENALLLEKIRDLIAGGGDFESVKSGITEYHNHTRLIFALESMNNLANNGRVSQLKAKMAGLLGIRAIGRASEEGTLEMICKSRGPLNTVNDILSNMIADGYSGGRVKIHHSDNPSTAELLKNRITEKFKEAKVDIARAGGLCSFYAEMGGILVGFEVEV